MLPGDQHFYCDADVEWSAEQLAGMADLYPPGEQLDSAPEDGEEPELPGAAGAELTRRLLALAPALEAADREAARREAERERAEQTERCREGEREQLLTADRQSGEESAAGRDAQPESESAGDGPAAPPTVAESTVASPAAAAADEERSADAPLRVRAVRGDGVSPAQVEVVVLEAGGVRADERCEAESAC